MKLILAALVAIMPLVCAQEAPAPKPVVVKSKAMKAEDFYHFAELIKARGEAKALAALQETKAVLPIDIEQNALFEKLCTDLGVPKDKLGECKPDIDQAKGKGFGEVRWEKPADVPNAAPTPAAAKPSPAPTN